MKKFLAITGITIAALYFIAHLILASGPVQKRVLVELQKALSTYGIELDIESIELSTFSPKIYLNRVSLQTNAQAQIQLPHPIDIDKIKIEFQPLALLSGQIVIDETALYHPRILIPKADSFYRRVMKLLDSQKKIVVEGAKLPVVIKRIGVVDAQFEVASQDPQFAIRSSSLTVFLERSAAGQQTVSIESPNLEVNRGALALKLKRFDVDLDFTEKSIRANHLIVQGDGISLDLKGASALPKGNEKLPSSFHVSHDVTISLDILTKIPELKLSGISGQASSQGTLHFSAGTYAGTGKVSGESLMVEGYKIGGLSTQYNLQEKKGSFSDVLIRYAGGTLESKLVTVDFTEQLPLAGEFVMAGVRLEGILDSVKEPDAPIRLALNGNLKANGTLRAPLKIGTQARLNFKEFWVINDNHKPLDVENTIIRVPGGSLDSNLTFTDHDMSFSGAVSALSGKASLEGKLIYGGDAKVSIDAAQVSLTDLQSIAGLQFGGVAKIGATLESDKRGSQIFGHIDLVDAEVANLYLGGVTGKVQYQNDLLSFTELQMQAIEPIRGVGHVDFRPTPIRYNFDLNARRVSMEQLLDIFEDQELPFESPENGEVTARVSIEGGHDNRGIEVVANGEARSFSWYGEKWMSSNYGFTYRPDLVDVRRGVLLKRTGALEVKGHFDDKRSQLVFSSNGLKLEELNHVGKAPLSGEVQGYLVLDQTTSHPKGHGEIQLSKLHFRGNPLEDVRLALKTQGNETLLDLVGLPSQVKGTVQWVDKTNGVADTRLKLSFQEYDLLPWLSLLMEKDIPPVAEVRVNGQLDLAGDFSKWETVDGGGELSRVTVGLKGTPLKSKTPVTFHIEKGSINVPKMELVGADSQLSCGFKLGLDNQVEGSLDGRIDLQFLQPFIPGVEYGTGRVSTGLRLSGRLPKYNLIGNVKLEDGSFRLTGLMDEFRQVQAQVSVSQERLGVERFQALLGGGNVSIEGGVEIARFSKFAPKLSLFVSKSLIRLRPTLSGKFTGDLTLKGEKTPYLLGGRTQIHELRLTSFDTNDKLATAPVTDASLAFDIKADANEHLFLQTDVVDAEFKGEFRLLGDTNQIGLTGTAEAIRGNLIFKETKFNLESGNAKFEDPKRVYPRFNVNGRTVVREERGTVPQDYDITLQVLGTPDDYRIRLSSTPPLAEPELISLLILGVTGQGQEGNYFDLGTTLVGQTPIQSKIQSELGFDIKVRTAPGQSNRLNPGDPNSAGDSNVPSVKIEKGITKKTKVSVSNTLGQTPIREFKLEQMLNESFTINATAGDRGRTTTQPRPGDSFGLDFRYRFQFE